MLMKWYEHVMTPNQQATQTYQWNCSMSKAATSILFRDLLMFSSTKLLVILTGGGTHFVSLHKQLSNSQRTAAGKCATAASPWHQIARSPPDFFQHLGRALAPDFVDEHAVQILRRSICQDNNHVFIPS